MLLLRYMKKLLQINVKQRIEEKATYFGKCGTKKLEFRVNSHSFIAFSFFSYASASSASFFSIKVHFS